MGNFICYGKGKYYPSEKKIQAQFEKLEQKIDNFTIATNSPIAYIADQVKKIKLYLPTETITVRLYLKKRSRTEKVDLMDCIVETKKLFFPNIFPKFKYIIRTIF